MYLIKWLNCSGSIPSCTEQHEKVSWSGKHILQEEVPCHIYSNPTLPTWIFDY